MLRLTDRALPGTRSRSASSSARPMQQATTTTTTTTTGAAIQVTSPPKPTFKPGTYVYEVDRVSNTIHKYRCGRVLGRGGFAKCYEVADEEGRYALKVVDRASLSKPKTLQKLHSEIAIHRRMRHPHIVQFIRTFKDAYYVYMLLEICENGTLMDLLKVRPLTIAEAQYVMLQCLQALQYMHDNLVIHRDLKPGNIMLDKELNVKIGDFGLAAELQYDGERKRTVCGTPNYIAPEIIDRHAQGHSYEVDTWSLGVMLYTLLVGQPPFQMEDVEATYSRIRQCRYDFPSSLSEAARDLIEHILQSSPSHRATLMDIRTHAFFAQPVPPTLPPLSFAAFKLAHTEVLQRQQGAPLVPLCGTASSAGTIAPVVQRRVSAPAECCPAVPQSVKDRVETMREVLRPVNPNVHEPRKPVPPQLAMAKPPSRRMATMSAPQLESPQYDCTYNVPLYRPQPTSTTSASAARKKYDEDNKENVVPCHAEPHVQRRRSSGGRSGGTGSAATSEENEKQPRGVKSPRRVISPRAPRAQLVEDEDEKETQAELTRMHDELHRTLYTDAITTTTTRAARAMTTDDNHTAGAALAVKEEDKEEGRTVSETRPKERNAAGPALFVPHAVLPSSDIRPTRSAPLQQSSTVPTPPVWLTHCADFSSKYGLCYRLNTGHTGAHFNDSTKMVWQPVTNRVEYYARVKVELPVASDDKNNNAGGMAVYARDELHAFDMSDSPAALEKKITLIKYFKSYLSRAHTNAQKDKVQVVRCSPYCDPTAARLADPHVAEDFVYVKRWLQTDEALVFRLSNKTVQVCFRDGAEVLLCSEWKVVTYTSPAGLRRTLPLSEVATESAEAAARLRYTKSILYQLIQDRCL